MMEYSEEMMKALVDTCLETGQVKLELGQVMPNVVKKVRETLHKAVLKYTAKPVEILTIDDKGSILLMLRRFNA